MKKGKCDNTDCTVSETGICLEAHEDPEQCPHFSLLDIAIEAEEKTEDSGGISGVQIVRQFHSGNELGATDASELMQKRYAHLIGIVGFYNAGKTCYLSSLYFLASHGGLQPDYFFAGSLTLQGFEDRVRRLRNWETGLPDKLAEHTSISDPRRPALMHIALRRQSPNLKRFDLLLTDLPGEWFTALVDNTEASSRFAFLRRADGIVFVIEGPSLNSSETRHSEIMRAQLLLRRLLFDVKVTSDTPLIFFVSKCDLMSVHDAPPGIDEIVKQASELGFKPEVVLGVSFSSKPAEFRSGTGVSETLKKIIEHKWPLTESLTLKKRATFSRSYWRYRMY